VLGTGIAKQVVSSSAASHSHKERTMKTRRTWLGAVVIVAPAASLRRIP